MTFNDLLTLVSAQLDDRTKALHTDAELLLWLTEGCRALAKRRPEVYSTTAAVTSTAGAKQSIPAAGDKFLAVVRQTNKGVVTPIDKLVLDRFCQDWPYGYYSTTPLHYMPHETEPRAFWVYPPLRAGVSLDVAYVPTIATKTAVSTLDAREEAYAQAVVDYACYRALSEPVAGDSARAAAHYQAFINATGGAPA